MESDNNIMFLFHKSRHSVTFLGYETCLSFTVSITDVYFLINNCDTIRVLTPYRPEV